jgi:phage-related protein
MMLSPRGGLKPVVWIGSAKADLCAFPEEVKDFMGFGGAGVLEIIEDHSGDTYRAVYTVRLADRVYVLHSFQKKSKTGIATPKAEINLIKARLQRAEEEHRAWLHRQRGIEKNG